MQRSTNTRYILSATCGVLLLSGGTMSWAQGTAPGEEFPAETTAPAEGNFDADGSAAAAASDANEDRGPLRGPQLELGIFGGYHVFGIDLELGLPDVPGRAPDHAPQFGLRLALNFLPWLGIETEASGISTEDRIFKKDVFVMIYRLHLLAHLADRGPVRPFVLAGVNLAQVASTDGSAALRQGIEYKDIDGGFHLGAGLKFDLSRALLLRLDARTSWLPDYHTDGLTPSFEFLAGFGVKIGGDYRDRPAAPPAPVDTDGDGIMDPNDQCPSEAEDLDSYQDEDGCPDLDNDGDGIPDANDRCPSEAETVNKIDDEDGCPETDEDKDGIFGTSDKCPTEPEDVDGFQDEDGCPDPDNDGDGVLDAQDKCPTEMETVNQFKDEDGCADEIPKEVQKFTGVIQGIQFKKNSASIMRRSFKVLGGAVKVLKDYPELRIQISGHTSSEGEHEFNMKLSQDRADSVKEYLVSAGIESGRIEAVGFGPDQPMAPNATRKGREQNRRIEFKLLGHGNDHGTGAAPGGTPQAPANPAPTP